MNHVYDDDKDSPYIVTIELLGTGEGGIIEGSDTMLVYVSRVPTIEVFAGDDRTVQEGSKVDYSASFTRHDELWDYQYQWDFGDGSPTETGKPEENAGRVELTHVFADYRPTEYTATLTINAISDAGPVSGSDSFAVRVTAAESFFVAGWNVTGTVKSAVRTLSAIAKVAMTVIIWAGILSPVALVAIGIIYLANRSRRVRDMASSIFSGPASSRVTPPPAYPILSPDPPDDPPSDETKIRLSTDPDPPAPPARPRPNGNA